LGRLKFRLEKPVIKSRLKYIFTLIVFAFFVSANVRANVAIAGKSFCEEPSEAGGAECVLAWEFDSLAPSTVDIEYYDTKEEKWTVVPGYKNIDADKKLEKPLQSLALYRVVACEGAGKCYSTTATWASVQPATIKEIPAYFDSAAGRRWYIDKNDNFEEQHQAYNLDLLNVFLLEIEAKDRLIPMTKPTDKIDAVANPGLTMGQVYRYQVHQWYEQFRDREAYSAWLDAWWPNWRNERMGYRQ
jgi:hypothetical protein